MLRQFGWDKPPDVVLTLPKTFPLNEDVSEELDADEHFDEGPLVDPAGFDHPEPEVDVLAPDTAAPKSWKERKTKGTEPKEQRKASEKRVDRPKKSMAVFESQVGRSAVARRERL